jgi:hypothetical protein
MKFITWQLRRFRLLMTFSGHCSAFRLGFVRGMAWALGCVLVSGGVRVVSSNAKLSQKETDERRSSTGDFFGEFVTAL